MSLRRESAATSFALSDRVSANPTHIWIEPTNRCNTRCTHCGHFYDKFGEDMSTPLFEKIRNSALDGVERVELIGYGEPLMARQFEAMMGECLRRDLEIYTTTNGILLANDKLVAKLVRSPMRLCLSLDGTRAETFEFVRPYIKWGKMIEVLECIKRNADDAGAEKKFSLRINYVAMKHSIADLPEMVRLAARYGASQIYVLPLGGDESFEKVKGQSLDISPELVSPSFLAALRLAARLRVEIIVPPHSFRSFSMGRSGDGGCAEKSCALCAKPSWG